MAVDTRKLVLGDWSRTVRDPLDVLRLAFLAGAIAFAFAGDPAGAFNLGLGFAVLLAARFANLPRVYDLALIVALVFTQWGEIGIFIADGSGSLAGGGLMVLWTRRGWGSVRRIPGENRREDTRA